VNGTLALQNGANLTLSGAAAGTFTVGANGTVSLLNQSSLDITAYNFTNVSSGGLLSGGSYVVGTDSTLKYSGASNINTIDVNTSVTLDNASGDNTGKITNGGVDAISNSLTTVNGTLALQNGASLTLSGATPATFTVGANGTLSAVNGSALDISAYNFTNVTGAGVLSGGNYFVGTNSTLNYSGAGNINTMTSTLPSRSTTTTGASPGWSRTPTSTQSRIRSPPTTAISRSRTGPAWRSGKV
jgi:fibronectin-binding autotransporter adhesin